MADDPQPREIWMAHAYSVSGLPPGSYDRVQISPSASRSRVIASHPIQLPRAWSASAYLVCSANN